MLYCVKVSGVQEVVDMTAQGVARPAANQQVIVNECDSRRSWYESAVVGKRLGYHPWLEVALEMSGGLWQLCDYLKTDAQNMRGSFGLCKHAIQQLMCHGMGCNPQFSIWQIQLIRRTHQTDLCYLLNSHVSFQTVHFDCLNMERYGCRCLSTSAFVKLTNKRRSCESHASPFGVDRPLNHCWLWVCWITQSMKPLLFHCTSKATRIHVESKTPAIATNDSTNGKHYSPQSDLSPKQQCQRDCNIMNGKRFENDTWWIGSLQQWTDALTVSPSPSPQTLQRCLISVV